MYHDPILRRRKQIIAGTVLLFAIVIIWATVVLANRIGKLPVVVAVVPANATVTFDKQAYSKGTQWIEPGTYKVSVSKNGFETVEKSITVTDEKPQNVVAISLSPKSNEAKEWAKNNQKDYANNEQYGAIEANVDGKYFSEKYPITTKLPFKDPYFTIGYTVGEKNSITITIYTPSPRYRFYAIEKIREFGYDPTDYTIVFKDFRNPLEQK